MNPLREFQYAKIPIYFSKVGLILVLYLFTVLAELQDCRIDMNFKFEEEDV